MLNRRQAGLVVKHDFIILIVFPVRLGCGPIGRRLPSRFHDVRFVRRYCFVLPRRCLARIGDFGKGLT